LGSLSGEVEYFAFVAATVPSAWRARPFARAATVLTFRGTTLFIDDVLRFALASALKDSSQRYRVIYE
jgi:hypothetical protein